MTFDITGMYEFIIPLQTMFLNETIKIGGHNLITFYGESFFMNRAINDEFNHIEYICIGSGVNPPQKMEFELGYETARNTCVKKVECGSCRIILNTSFTGKEIMGTTEIGVLASKYDGGEVLISHDVFTETILNEDFLYGIIGNVEIEYIFQFTSSNLKTNWHKHSKYRNVYYAYEVDDVLSVKDNVSGSGYKKGVDEVYVSNNVGSYCYDKTTNNLYIHCYGEENPNDKEILIESKPRGVTECIW